MKQLEDALRIDHKQESASVLGHSRVKSLGSGQRWSLDPDFLEEGPQDAKERFTNVTKDILNKRFTNQKYLEDETFRQLLAQLTGYLPNISSELHRLIRIEQTLQELGESLLGEMKNYIKQFQGLLDARIRKLKKRQKRVQLLEFDRIACKEGLMKRKNPVAYINQDDKTRNKFKEYTYLESSSKKSFGTMNSGQYNQNESASGKSKSASESKSGEANALTVLLANVGRPEDKKYDKAKDTHKDVCDYSSVLSASIAVRQRSPVHKLPEMGTLSFEEESDRKAEEEVESEKDEAFIFHRPKAVRKGKN